MNPLWTLPSSFMRIRTLAANPRTDSSDPQTLPVRYEHSDGEQATGRSHWVTRIRFTPKGWCSSEPNPSPNCSYEVAYLELLNNSSWVLKLPVTWLKRLTWNINIDYIVLNVSHLENNYDMNIIEYRWNYRRSKHLVKLKWAWGANDIEYMTS